MNQGINKEIRTVVFIITVLVFFQLSVGHAEKSKIAPHTQDVFRFWGKKKENDKIPNPKSK